MVSAGATRIFDEVLQVRASSFSAFQDSQGPHSIQGVQEMTDIGGREVVEVPRLNRASVAALERVFAAEIEGHLLQSKAKIYDQLERDGYVERTEERIAVPPLGTMTVKGWVLTHAGRLTYCMTCDDGRPNE